MSVYLVDRLLEICIFFGRAGLHISGSGRAQLFSGPTATGHGSATRGSRYSGAFFSAPNPYATSCYGNKFLLP